MPRPPGFAFYCRGAPHDFFSRSLLHFRRMGFTSILHLRQVGREEGYKDKAAQFRAACGFQLNPDWNYGQLGSSVRWISAWFFVVEKGTPLSPGIYNMPEY